jgi:CubicO group peptidase (beta-lactamase class C family)
MDKLNKILQPYIDQERYPGIQWQINVNDEKYTGKLGYKNLETKDKISEDTIYRIWSMTKPVIAIATMQLVARNQMQLDDPITKYLPKYSNLKVLKNPDGDITDVEELKMEPTVKHLLLHTAGFSYNFLADPVGMEYERMRIFKSTSSSLEEEIQMLAKVPLLYQPSTQWRYSVSMDVLARILEIVENSTLQDILKNKIFLPLGMHDTDFFISEQKDSRMMQSYEFDVVHHKLREHIQDPQKIGNYGYPLHNKNYARGGHGLFSTLHDYSLFADMLHSGKTKDGKLIIKKETIDFMTSNFLTPSFFPIEIASVGTIKDENYVNDLEAYGWGFGFRTLLDPEKNNNLGTKGEFGWAGAASTYFLVDNHKKISAILMTQVVNGDPNLKKDFYQFIYTHFI